MDLILVHINNKKYDLFVISNDRYITPTLANGYEWDGWMREDLGKHYKEGTDILESRAVERTGRICRLPSKVSCPQPIPMPGGIATLTHLLHLSSFLSPSLMPSIRVLTGVVRALAGGRHQPCIYKLPLRTRMY